jgi:hypothetical protein
MRRPWTEDEIKLAREMRAAGHFYEEIDWALRRRAGATKRQLKGVDQKHGVRLTPRRRICLPNETLLPLPATSAR